MSAVRRVFLFLVLIVAVQAPSLWAQQAAGVRILAVTVEGNRITKERIILREITFQAGDSLSVQELYARLERSKQNLRNLSLFNTVEVLPLYVSSSEAIITVMVSERWYWWPELIFKVADPNFNTWWLTRDFDRVNWGFYLNRYNFRGRNELLYLKFQFGYTRSFGARYRVPYIDRRQRWGLSIGGGYAEQSEVTAGTVGNKRIFATEGTAVMRAERTGDVQITFRPAHDVRHSARLGLVHASIADTLLSARPDYFRNGASVSAYAFLGYSYIFDRRDSRIFPLNGPMLEMAVDRHGLGGGRAAPDITVLQARAEMHRRLATRWSLGMSVRGRYTAEGTPPYYEQNGLGYERYVRGYEYYVVDGKHAVVGKTNLQFAVLPPREYHIAPMPLEAFRTLYLALYLNAFVDVGRAWDTRYATVNPLANTWLHGYGLGLNLVSSYDQVLRVEYARNGLAEGGFYLHFQQPF